MFDLSIWLIKDGKNNIIKSNDSLTEKRGKMILNRENISIGEIKALKYWTSPSKEKYYRKIKKASENKYLGKKYDIDGRAINWFYTIEFMFDKYKDNTDNDIIYRCDIIDNIYNLELTFEETFNKFLEDKIVGKVFKFDDLLLSFSKNRDYAIYASENNDKFKSTKTPRVLYILEKRKSKYLYIEEFSAVYNEAEVLGFRTSNFKINEINLINTNFIEIKIEEI